MAAKRREIKGVGWFKFKGVPKGDHFDRLAELAAVNPNFVSGLDEWRKNCQRCTVAYEARRRGFDVTAMSPKTGNDAVADHWLDYFDGAAYEDCPTGNGYNEVVEKMRKWGPGSRAIVYVAWRDYAELAHVFSAENIAGRVVFSDPQASDRDCSWFFGMAKDGYTAVMRVDNAQFGKWSKGCLEDA